MAETPAQVAKIPTVTYISQDLKYSAEFEDQLMDTILSRPANEHKSSDDQSMEWSSLDSPLRVQGIDVATLPDSWKRSRTLLSFASLSKRWLKF